MALTRKKIASLSYAQGHEEFLNETDGMVHLLKDFLMAFPYANFKRSVWNEYEKMDMAKALQRVNNSPYGADITIEYDDDWENGYERKRVLVGASVHRLERPPVRNCGRNA